jgi:hypothetical protein
VSAIKARLCVKRRVMLAEDGQHQGGTVACVRPRGIRGSGALGIATGFDLEVWLAEAVEDDVADGVAAIA